MSPQISTKILLLQTITRLFFLTVIVSVGCVIIKQPFLIKNNQRYCVVKGLFLGDWDDYYERALSCIEGEFYDQALHDLNHALNLRYYDKRVVNTYGKHYIMDYFPHREKGFIYYKKKDYQSAIKELEISLEHVVSSKAAYYLDQSIKARMIMENVPESVPQISMDQKLPLRTRNDSVVISGTAIDSLYISDILLSKESIYLGAANQSVRFNKELFLPHGTYQFELTAVNLINKKSTKNIVIQVDKMAPIVSIKNDGNFIEGIVYDTSGFVLYINNELIVKTNKKESSFKILRKNLSNQIHFFAKDQLGNETSVFIKRSEICGINYWIAQNSLNRASDTQPSMTTLAKNESIIKTNLSHNQIVFNKDILISGSITGKNTVRRIAINNIDINTISGRIIFFNYPLSLKKGINEMYLEAFDIKNRRIAAKKLTVYYNLPEIYKIHNRYSATQHPFDHTDKLQKNILFQFYFLQHIMNENRFLLQIDYALEQMFKQNNLFHEIEQKKKLFSNSFLLGTIYNSVHGYEVAVRVVRQHRDILAAEDIYSERSDTKTLYNLSCILAAKIKNNFPMITGKVTRMSDSGFVAVFNKAEKIPTNWPMIIYEDLQAKSIHCTDMEIIAFARMQKYLNDNKYLFQINRRIKNRFVKPGDGIITQ